MMKGMTYWSLEGGLEGKASIAHALETAQAEAFEALELAIGPEGVLTPETTKAECEQIRRQIDEAGITVQTLASGMTWLWNPTSDDPDTREQAIAAHEAALRIAGDLGCQALLYIPGVVTSPIAPGETVRYDHALERAAAAVQRLLKTAEAVGVDLCIENVWNGLLLSPVEMRDFIDQFNSDRLGVYLDIGNLPRYHQHPPHWVQILGPRIKRVHLKDFKVAVGTLEGFCDLLEGDVPMAESMQGLRNIGYDRTVIPEMIPYAPGQLTRASRAMDEILKMA